MALSCPCTLGSGTDILFFVGRELDQLTAGEFII